MFAQKAHHQLGHRQPRRRRQLPPLRPDPLVVEQTELDDLGPPSPRTAALSGHRCCSDSGGENLSVHQNQQQPLPLAIASVQSAASGDLQALPGRPSANPPSELIGKRLDRTSTPAIRANVPIPNHPRCTEIFQNVALRRSDERGPSGQTRDDRGRELPGAPSHGRSVVAFYNQVRPHSSLGYLTLTEFAARAAQQASHDATGWGAAVFGPPRPAGCANALSGATAARSRSLSLKIGPKKPGRSVRPRARTAACGTKRRSPTVGVMIDILPNWW